MTLKQRNVEKPKKSTTWSFLTKTNYAQNVDKL